MLFFEKKNQKTFAACGRLWWHRRHVDARHTGRKFFGSLFQKITLPFLLFLPCAAHAQSFDITWNTTVRVSLGLRTEAAAPSLLANINADDGDRAFRTGPISERVDAVTEVTGERGALGFDMSAQGWYDAAYQGETANTSPATFNGAPGAYRSFPPGVRGLMGQQAELLNAYMRDTVDVGNRPVTLSVGRQTLLWGESLLFAQDGIAGAMAPVDDIKSLGAPLATAREVFLPVTQIVARAGLGGGLSVEAYDQLEWRRDRLPGVDSYFSTTDILDTGGERLLGAGGAPTLWRRGDDVPHGVGQFGLALRQSGDVLDWGVYALNADSRSPFVVLDPAAYTYHLVFVRDIQIYGASGSFSAGDTNIAGELSWQRGVPLTGGAAAPQAGGSEAGGGTYFAYAMPPPPVPRAGETRIARGTIVNAQISAQAVLPPGRFADAASVQAELDGNQLVAGLVPAGRTRVAAALRAIITPQYFHVLPGLDMGVPVGGGIGLLGRSAVDATQNAGAGFVSAGVNATFHVDWQASLLFTHFVGGAGAQPLADRDFVTISATRSF